MIGAILWSLAALVGDTLAYSGRAHSLEVHPPKIDAHIVVDGQLDEPAWTQAARMTDFSSYFPTDGQPAPDSTEVLVWYSATAIHFGVRAYAASADVRATLATRDALQQDDVVAIFLSTFNDGRQAYVFSANPFGVQQDGVLSETTTQSGTGSLFGGLAGGRPLAELSPDFVFESKGRLTDFGYQIEFEVPFKSFRYQSKDRQTWGINIERTHRATGAVSTWAPVKRDAASYLGQVGSLVGLEGLHRGRVLDLTPVVTSTVTGAPSALGGWSYDGGSPRLGADVRWGATADLTVNGTIRPDFSQVESDAGQVSFDPRASIYYNEKRLFFLEGSELFDTPSNLVYTRRVVEPLAATKLSGKVSGTNVGLLAAIDDRNQSTSGRDHPVFAIGRLQRDLGSTSRIGIVYTGRYEGGSANQVAGIDTRLTLSRNANLNAQIAASHTGGGGLDRNGLLWNAAFDLGGRRLSLRYTTNAVSDDFETQSGFINRGAIANVRFVNQMSFYGKRGALVERFAFDVSPFFTWRYDDLVHGAAAQDHKYHFNTSIRFRGGWTAAASFLYEFQKFDPGFYAPYAILRPGAGGVDTVPFVGTPELHNVDWLVQLTTPQLGGFSGNLFAIWGRDVNFFEWSRAKIVNVTANLSWRPSEQLRLDGSYILLQYRRHSDGSLVGRTQIPRLKVEYQLTRSLFLRAVAEYRGDVRDSLRDDTRTELPLVIRDPVSGQYQAATALDQRTLRADWLVAFQPNPGTVVFAGYGNTEARDLATKLQGLHRVADGFFVKVSYLFRI